PFAYNIAYAESRDGLAWERSPLSVFDALPEDPANNFIKLGSHKTQHLDIQLNPDPDHVPGKYVALHNDSGGVFVSTSEDGKTFTLLTGKPVFGYHSDTTNNFVYDEVRKRWFLYCRPRAYAG